MSKNEIPESQRRANASAEREAYLAEITKALASRLTPLETYEQIDEMRHHLSAMASAYEEIGCPPDQAMQNALRKFGDPSVIAKGILQGMKKPASFRILGDPLTPQKAAASMVAFIKLILGGTAIGAALAGAVAAILSMAGLTALSPATFLTIGAYASCIVATLCWSFPKRRPLGIGFTAAGFALGIALLPPVLVVLVTGTGPAAITPLLLIVGATFAHGYLMAMFSRRLRARLESDYVVPRLAASSEAPES